MLTHPDFDPVLIHIGGPIAVRWYGLMYLLGFAAAWWLGRRQAAGAWPWSGAGAGATVSPRQVDDMVFVGMVGAVVGGRVGSVLFYHFNDFLADPLMLARIWEGGMSFHGGLLGVALALWWHGRRQGLRFFDIADFAAPLVPLGLGAGRIGNFINQELVGRATDLPWGMVFPAIGDNIARHPSQLYQAGLEGAALFVLLVCYSAAAPPRMAVSGMFLGGYGVFRFIAEFARAPDAHIGFVAFGWLTMGQLLSLPMVVAGAVLLSLAYRPRGKTA